MKRLALSLAAVAVLVVGSAAAAFAQTPTPPTDQPYWGHMGWGGAGGYSGSYDPASNPTLKRLADKIGIGAADLVKELQSGKSVADVAKAKNVDEQALVDLLLAPQADTLAIQVKYGYLTQDQADAIQKLAADRIKYQLEQKGFSGGFGYGHMMGGYGIGGMMGGYGMMGGGFGGMMGGSGGMMGRGFGPTAPRSGN